MIRIFTLALAATAFAGTALAAEVSTQTSTATHALELKSINDAKQAQNILAHRGYVAISDLERDADGRWVGTAIKDGKTIFVSVALPRQVANVAN